MIYKCSSSSKGCLSLSQTQNILSGFFKNERCNMWKLAFLEPRYARGLQGNAIELCILSISLNWRRWQICFLIVCHSCRLWLSESRIFLYLEQNIPMERKELVEMTRMPESLILNSLGSQKG